MHLDANGVGLRRVDDYEQALQEFEEVVEVKYDDSLQQTWRELERPDQEEGRRVVVVRDDLRGRLRTAASGLPASTGRSDFLDGIDGAEQRGKSRYWRLWLTPRAVEWLNVHQDYFMSKVGPDQRRYLARLLD